MTETLSTATEKRKFSWQKLYSYWFPLFSYMGLIFYTSSIPEERLIIPEIWNIDKVIHIVEYGILGVLWFRVIGLAWEKSQKVVIIAFTITFLYGISDEFHQYFVPGRNADIYDAIANGIGAWLGIWFYKRR